MIDDFGTGYSSLSQLKHMHAGRPLLSRRDIQLPMFMIRTALDCPSSEGITE
jgi:predicted signal transduction protein with EAL and GGDEF domain